MQQNNWRIWSENQISIESLSGTWIFKWYDTIARDGFPVKFGEALESKGNLQKLVGAVINQHTKLNQKSYNMSSSIGVKSMAKHIKKYPSPPKSMSNPSKIHRIGGQEHLERVFGSMSVLGRPKGELESRFSDAFRWLLGDCGCHVEPNWVQKLIQKSIISALGPQEM